MEGAIPSDTYISFAIGGAAYSKTPNPWAWLTSQEAAEAMAVEVAKWRDLYNVDGIDLDIEAGAGDRQVKGNETLHRKIINASLLSGSWAQHVAFHQ